MSWVRRLGVLALATLLGGVLGFAVIYLFLNGWFQSWTRVAEPPEAIASIRLISGPQVWVETRSGALYHNPAADTCQANCWTSVLSLPAELPPLPEINTVFPETCVSAPPLLGAVERKAECQRADWIDYNTVYARRASGALLVWRYESGGEFTVLLFPIGVILGAAAFFVLAAALLLVQGLARMARQRARPTA